MAARIDMIVKSKLAATDPVGEQCMCSGIVGLDGGSWLRMAHFFECLLHGHGRFGVDEQCSHFSLCGR